MQVTVLTRAPDTCLSAPVAVLPCCTRSRPQRPARPMTSTDEPVRPKGKAIATPYAQSKGSQELEDPP